MYLKWNEQTITDFSDANINSLYNQGFLFTREGRGAMYQTRSLRVDLEKFELTSENRRVLKKNADCRLQIAKLPLDNYDWKIGKMAKDFYETKFGEGTFSANKVKELLTTKHNFNTLLQYSIDKSQVTGYRLRADGYAICYTNSDIIHYSYPFYNLKPITYNLPPDLGLGMMLKAIIWAKEAGHVKPDGHVASKKYVYLGSAKDAKAKYKLQFAGLEWFDGKKWRNDVGELKKIL